MAEAVARTGWRENEITSVCARIPEIAKVRGVLIAKSALDLVRKGLFHVLENFHKEDPLAAGLSKEALRERLKDISPDVFSPVFDDALKNRQIALNGDLVHLPGRGVEMQGDEVESRKTIEQAFASAGLKVPALKDVVSGLQIDKARAQKIVTLLLREKLLIKVSDDLVFHRAALDQLRTSLTKRKQKDPKTSQA
jgi:selenocysteine-specific elongation factor